MMNPRQQYRRMIWFLMALVVLCCREGVFARADADANNKNKVALLEELHRLGMPGKILPHDSSMEEIQELVNQFRQAVAKNGGVRRPLEEDEEQQEVIPDAAIAKVRQLNRDDHFPPLIPEAHPLHNRLKQARQAHIQNKQQQMQDVLNNNNNKGGGRRARRGGNSAAAAAGGLYRQEWDKKTDFLFTLPSNMTKLPLHPKVEWLGVLLDGGRHYFDVEWILNLLDMLSVLQFNLLHFRLTDDQAFNVKLESHPELATPAYESNGKVYSVAELRKIQAHAKERNITIMPEINVPGHAASWAGGGLNMLPSCAKFICKEGYGVPLNVTYPPLMNIIKDVIKEVMEIFEYPPHLHLGGDEVHLAEPCFHELQTTNQDYATFEKQLSNIIHELNISENGILRWEMTSQLDHNGRPIQRKNTPESNQEFINYQVEGRTGDMTHWWHAHHDHLYDDMPGEGGTSHVFVSQGLYMDINNMMPGAEVYQHVSNLARHKWKPKGIVVGCFELGMQFWWDRGVIGRLLAASMGASDAGNGTTALNQQINPQDYDFDDRYKTYCKDYLHLSDDYCGLLGVPPVDANKWRSGPWRQLRFNKWKDMVCDRLTEPGEQFQLIGRNPAKETIQTDAMMNFWNHFGGQEVGAINLHNNQLEKAMEGRFGQHSVPKTGIILDLTHDYMGENDSSRTERIREVLDVMAKLGFNFLQLRVMDDYYFQLEMPSHRNLATTQQQQQKTGKGRKETTKTATNEEETLYRQHHDVSPMSYSDLKTVVEYARQHGIEVMPEISVTSRAGGWIHSGFNTPCPNYMCNYGVDLKVQLEDPAFLGVLSSVVYELRDVFSSDYFHLGYAHDPVNVGCFEEAGGVPDVDAFEQKLELLMELQGVPPEKIVRWEYPTTTTTNDDKSNKAKKKVAGTTIHTLNQQEPTKGAFVTTGLNFEDPENELQDAWAIYDHVKGLTSVEPDAVLAWVGSFGSSIWDRLFIKERLLAVALALSKSQEDYGTKEDFEPVYKEACQQFQWKHCDEFGKIPADKVKLLTEELNKDFEAQLDEVCASRTKKYKTRLPRRGVLIPGEAKKEPVTTADAIAAAKTEEPKEEKEMKEGEEILDDGTKQTREQGEQEPTKQTDEKTDAQLAA